MTTDSFLFTGMGQLVVKTSRCWQSSQAIAFASVAFESRRSVEDLPKMLVLRSVFCLYVSIPGGPVVPRVRRACFQMARNEAAGNFQEIWFLGAEVEHLKS